MEISRENTSGTSGNKSEKSDNSKTKKSKGSSKSKQRDSNSSSGSTSSKGSTSESKKSNPDLSSKLGKDGKLTPQERQHHLDKNLCLFCGVSGHMAKDCPKSTSAAVKACAALQPVPKTLSDALFFFVWQCASFVTRRISAGQMSLASGPTDAFSPMTCT